MKYILILTAIFLISCGTNGVYREPVDTNDTEIIRDSNLDDSDDSDSIIVYSTDTRQPDSDSDSNSDSDTTICTDNDSCLGIRDTESESDSETDWNTDTGTGTEKEEDSESESESSGTDTGIYVDTDSESDTGTDTSETDTGMETEEVDTDTNPTCSVPTDCPTGLDDAYNSLLMQYRECIDGHCVLQPLCPHTYDSACMGYSACNSTTVYWNTYYRCEGIAMICCQKE